MTADNSTSTPSTKVLIRGVMWIGVFRWSAQVLSWAAFLIVIRHISPEDYGIAGLSLAVVAVVTVVCEFGLGTAVIASPRWMPSVTPLRNLLIYAALTGIATPVAQILNVTGRTRIGMISAIIALVVLPPAFVLGAWLDGIRGIAVTWVLLFPVLTIIPLSTALRELEISFVTYLTSFRAAVEAVVAMVITVIAVRQMPFGDDSHTLELICSVLAGACIYAGLLYLRQRDWLLSIRNEIKGSGQV